MFLLLLHRRKFYGAAFYVVFVVMKGSICTMSMEAVRRYLDLFGLKDRIQEFSQSSATVELAAQALSVIPARIAKTLSFLVGDGCVLVVTAGDAKIDNGKYKQQFGTKAKMLTPEQVVFFTGHAVGGVCPFALPADADVKVYTDCSLQRFDVVSPAAGTASSAVRLSCQELFETSRSQGWIDVCKGWQLEEQG